MTTPSPLTSAELADLKAKPHLLPTIQRLIATIEQRDAWQPIETAPKDGTPFIAFFPGDGEIEMVHWSAALDPENGADDGWYVYRCEEGWPITGQFSHWQPLAAPPSEALAATEIK